MGITKQRRAVYNNRARISSGVGKEAARKRTEFVERSFEFCFDRCGGMRRTWLRGDENVEKRYLIHVTTGFNLGLLVRARFGVVIPREAAARGHWCLLMRISGIVVILFIVVGEDLIHDRDLAA